MCYSRNTSIISYIIGMLSAFFALYTNQYILGGLILFYSQIQLSEIVIWDGIDKGDTKQNILGTNIGKFALSCQNIGLSLGILYTMYKKNSINFYSFIPLIISIFFTLIVFRLYLSDKTQPSYPENGNCDNNCQNPSNRLIWSYEISWYIYSAILTVIFILLYVEKWWSKIYIIFMLIILTLGIAIIQNKKAFSSLWCFNAAILAPIIVIGNYYIIYSR